MAAERTITTDLRHTNNLIVHLWEIKERNAPFHAYIDFKAAPQFQKC